MKAVSFLLYLGRNICFYIFNKIFYLCIPVGVFRVLYSLSFYLIVQASTLYVLNVALLPFHVQFVVL